jgi:hypothetical protein
LRQHRQHRQQSTSASSGCAGRYAQQYYKAHRDAEDFDTIPISELRGPKRAVLPGPQRGRDMIPGPQRQVSIKRAIYLSTDDFLNPKEVVERERGKGKEESEKRKGRCPLFVDQRNPRGST